MAALAVDAGMKTRVVDGGLMAAATRARSCMNLRSRGMRIVTSYAAGGGSGPGMIGVNVTVTLPASLLGCTAHVVRRVAARALPMARRMSPAQNRELLVARAARRRLVFGELVRAMTTHALPMPGLEQRRFGNNGRLLGVTRHTSLERFRSRGISE
jgi:hypothetical protein